jgi:hypothetical protein
LLSGGKPLKASPPGQPLDSSAGTAYQAWNKKAVGPPISGSSQDAWLSEIFIHQGAGKTGIGPGFQQYNISARKPGIF